MATYLLLKSQATQAGTAQKAKLRATVTYAVWGTLGALAFLLVTGWIIGYMTPDAEKKATAEKATTVAPARVIAPVVAGLNNCDNTKRKFTLFRLGTLINGGDDCYMVEWERDEAVTLSDNRQEKTFPAGYNGRFYFKATSWRCADTLICTVTAVFCPTKYWDDAARVCRLGTT